MAVLLACCCCYCCTIINTATQFFTQIGFLFNKILLIVLVWFNSIFGGSLNVNRWFSKTLQSHFNEYVCVCEYNDKIRNIHTHIHACLNAFICSIYTRFTHFRVQNPFYGNWSELSCKLSLINQMSCVNKFNWNWSRERNSPQKKERKINAPKKIIGIKFNV